VTVPIEVYQLRSVPRWIICQIWWTQSMLLIITISIDIALVCRWDMRWMLGFLLTNNRVGVLTAWDYAVPISTGHNFSPIRVAYWICILHWHLLGLKAHLAWARASGSLSYMVLRYSVNWLCAKLTDINFGFIKILNIHWILVFNQCYSGLKARPNLIGASGSLSAWRFKCIWFLIANDILIFSKSVYLQWNLMT
jgi:hypothetical protein